jgi:hypothetical protein
MLPFLVATRLTPNLAADGRDPGRHRNQFPQRFKRLSPKYTYVTRITVRRFIAADSGEMQISGIFR